ncbi:hypothetical protein [Streptomyces sp. NPDC003077]|uniref:hypothetical protein n=1 Tax=Streptomyces sp. NPDC003077 TaxID=3154443 RepID=UPI0033B3C312
MFRQPFPVLPSAVADAPKAAVESSASVIAGHLREALPGRACRSTATTPLTVSDALAPFTACAGATGGTRS